MTSVHAGARGVAKRARARKRRHVPLQAGGDELLWRCRSRAVFRPKVKLIDKLTGGAVGHVVERDAGVAQGAASFPVARARVSERAVASSLGGCRLGNIGCAARGPHAGGDLHALCEGEGLIEQRRDGARHAPVLLHVPVENESNPACVSRLSSAKLVTLTRRLSEKEPTSWANAQGQAWRAQVYSQMNDLVDGPSNGIRDGTRQLVSLQRQLL